VGVHAGLQNWRSGAHEPAFGAGFTQPRAPGRRVRHQGGAGKCRRGHGGIGLWFEREHRHPPATDRPTCLLVGTDLFAVVDARHSDQVCGNPSLTVRQHGVPGHVRPEPVEEDPVAVTGLVTLRMVVPPDVERSQEARSCGSGGPHIDRGWWESFGKALEQLK
jgi:hypothetical protein